MSQQELCRLIFEASEGELRMPQSQLSDIESFKKPINLQKAQIIAKIFNVSLHEVINVNVDQMEDTETSNLISLDMFTTDQLQRLKLKIDTELTRRGIDV